MTLAVVSCVMRLELYRTAVTVTCCVTVTVPVPVTVSCEPDQAC